MSSISYNSLSATRRSFIVVPNFHLWITLGGVIPVEHYFVRI